MISLVTNAPVLLIFPVTSRELAPNGLKRMVKTLRRIDQ